MSERVVELPSQASRPSPEFERTPPQEQRSAASRVTRCSGCQAGRPSRLRVTAEEIAAQGSSGATGASEPKTTDAPEESRSANR